MRSYQIQKTGQFIQQKSMSASSFYRPTSKPISKQPNIAHSIQTQQRQVKEQMDKLKQTLDIKMEYITKRTQQSNEESNKTMKELLEIEKDVADTVREVNKTDKTKQWAVQMEKSIQAIMLSSKQNHTQGTTKHIQECQKAYQIYQQYENKIRQEKRQREREWEEIIDNVGETIIDSQSVIQAQRQQIQSKMAELELQVLDVEEEVALGKQLETKNRKQEHQYLTKLIERIMEKLIC